MKKVLLILQYPNGIVAFHKLKFKNNTTHEKINKYIYDRYFTPSVGLTWFELSEKDIEDFISMLKEKW